MKIISLSLLLFIYSFASGQYHFKIHGQAPDIFNNKKIYLTVWDRYSNNKYVIKDSTTVRNNNFTFEGVISKPSEQAVLHTNQVKGYRILVVDSGLNQIVIHLPAPKSPLYKNKLSETVVLDSRSNAIERQLDSLGNLFYLTKGKPSVKNKNFIELADKDKIDLKAKELSVLKQNTDVFYTLIELYGMSNKLNTNEIEDIYKSLSSEIKNSELGIEFEEMLQNKKNSEIGSSVKEFTAKTVTGNEFSSSLLKGKPYLLAFGATWCVPCKERLPVLKQQYRKYRSLGLEIVYVNLDANTDKWKNQVTKDKMQWINISENVEWSKSKIAKQFNVTAVPLYFIIDKKGTIIYNERQLKDGELKLLANYITEAVK